MFRIGIKPWISWWPFKRIISRLKTLYPENGHYPTWLEDDHRKAEIFQAEMKVSLYSMESETLLRVSLYHGRYSKPILTGSMKQLLRLADPSVTCSCNTQYTEAFNFCSKSHRRLGNINHAYSYQKP
jgi:hypothetical protein